MQLLRTTYIHLVLIALIVTISGCAGAGRTAFSKGEAFEAEGKLDEAVVQFASAASENPEVGEYRMRFLKAGEKAAQVHLKKGDAFLAAERYDAALSEFQTSVALDSSLDRAKQQSELVLKLRNSLVYLKEGEELEKSRKPREALNSYQQALQFNPDNEKAKEAIERLLKSRKSKLDGSELNLKSTKPITLKFKDAKLKDVFNIITQLSGINFVFDDGIKDSNVSIYLENASFQQVLDVITGMQKLSKKILNETTIILYPRTPEKQKQYEDLMVQTFYLNKLDAKKAVNLIRTMLQVKKIYVNEEMNALVIRDVPEVIEVARKIIEANDVPDAEVLLEVEVIEVSKKNAESLGLVLSKYALSTNALTPGGQFFSDVLTNSTSTSTDSTTTNTVTASNLLQVFNWRKFQGYVTVPNATFNFGKTLSNAETLASPKIRVKNREKAKFNVGTRVPITTTSSPTGGGVSVNVQYVDVGVKVNAEPTIQLNNDVNMKLSLEVSSILSREKIGDSTSLTTVVTIGTRNLDTVLSLKDGETSVIGGLIQDAKTNSKQKVSVLGDIPLIGALFSGKDDSNDKSELILAITPRIVRSLTVPEGDAAIFWSGREDEPTVHRPYSSFEQEPEFAAPAATPAFAPQPAAAPASAPAAIPQPSVAPLASPAPVTAASPLPTPLAPASSAAASTGVTAAATPAVTASPTAQPAVVAPIIPVVPSQSTDTPSQAAVKAADAPLPQTKPARLSVTIGAPSTVKVKDQFIVEIKAADVVGLQNAPFILAYDPIFVEYVGAAEGNLLRQDGKAVTFRVTDDKNTGQVTFALNRPADSGGVNGSGTLATVTFRARNQGPASFGLMAINFTGQGGKQYDVLPYNSVVEVK
ncbi:MAG: type II secretion system protein [Geobacter sp.]|nr:type II secretion system protein [Geobacter sp.]